MKRMTLLVTTLALLTACSSHVSATTGGSPDPSVSARYTRIAPQGYIDQSLVFSTSASEPVTVHATLTPRDANGRELPDVRVSTVFGTDLGRVAVMPEGTIDIVRLDGPRAAEVADVTLSDAAVEPAHVGDAPHDIDVVPVDAKGRDLTYDMYARTARVVNTNEVPVHAHVVLLVLRAPQDGVPQAATLVHDVTTVDVPAHGSTTIALDPATRKILMTRGATSFVALHAAVAPDSGVEG